jgi:AraC family transcriptional regulator, transcriptional activator of the genes for pyochelin and ferripyochelin receptors
MNSISHLLSTMTFASREYGNIMCKPVAIQSPPAPPLFTDVEDVLALQASGPFGSFALHELKNENYCVRHDQYDLMENLHLSANADIQSLGLHYALRNNIRSISAGFPEDLMLKNHYNMIYVPSIESEFLFEKEQEYINFGIIFTPDYLERCSDAFSFLSPFLKRISRKVPSRLREKHPSVTPDIILAIRSILQCDYSGTLKKMYLDSKVPELLLLSLKNIAGGREAIIRLNNSDIQKLHQAREYLLAHIENPCSIRQLAHEVALNDFKLKNGFKQLFNNTIFGVILDERMQKARTLLLETSSSVHEISILVGYKNLSNFTAAFKRKFGYPPTTLRH